MSDKSGQPTDAPSGKIPFSKNLAYAIGGFPDFFPYNLFYIYFLFFFTDVAGFDPGVGGTICMIVIIWDAVTDPLVGYLSDNSKSKRGRRRPFMAAALIPLAVTTVMLFSAFETSPRGAFFYYLIVGLLLWTFYTMYDIPYYALGAELTDDFDERGHMRILLGIPIFIAGWLEYAGPMFIWDWVSKLGRDKYLWMNSDQFAWFLSALILETIAVASGYYCIRKTKGTELIDRDPERAALNMTSGKQFIKNYMELCRNRAVKWLSFFAATGSLVFSIAQGSFVYLMANNLGLSESMQGTYWTLDAVISLAHLPLMNYVSRRFGKKQCMLLYTLIACTGCLAFYFIGIASFLYLCMYATCFLFFSTSFWTVGTALVLDCCEVDEFLTGQRREAAIQGVVSFAMKAGAAIGTFFNGWLLKLAGYDGMAQEQTAGTLHGILALNTLVPAVMLIVTGLFLVMYPINKKNYNLLLNALAQKKEGKPYSTEGFEKLLPANFDHGHTLTRQA
ncbi:MAG: glycoside-pentoside-hexuronide (GPH):cation symporter [Synergistaceae bacterium]|jgi:GPH family glycoside/pentoside/hexuronide:cation symporter|nr:glycoside-pentoside-hexuronide (GPH):cation symporter [Synergistaceae bacterium]